MADRERQKEEKEREEREKKEREAEDERCAALLRMNQIMKDYQSFIDKGFDDLSKDMARKYK